MEVIKIYTDGGCRGNHLSENVGGWGAYLKCGDITKELAGYEYNTTNNKMELRGAIEGLKAIKSNKYKVELYLDSAYVLNGLTSWISKWKKNGWRTSSKKPVQNIELWKELDEVRSRFSNIEYIKVKGHSGEYGNEMADKLLNKAMDLAGENF